MTSYGASKESVSHLSKPPHVEVGSAKEKMFSTAFGVAFGSCPTVFVEEFKYHFFTSKDGSFHLFFRDVKKSSDRSFVLVSSKTGP